MTLNVFFWHFSVVKTVFHKEPIHHRASDSVSCSRGANANGYRVEGTDVTTCCMFGQFWDQIIFPTSRRVIIDIWNRYKFSVKIKILASKFWITSGESTRLVVVQSWGIYNSEYFLLLYTSTQFYFGGKYYTFHSTTFDNFSQ